MSDPAAPEAGEVIWTDFDPSAGREQAGRRPALVVSPAIFFTASGFALMCPITGRVRPFGTSVVLPPGFPLQGEILTSHVHSIDLLARPIRTTGYRVPEAVLFEVRAKLAAIAGITP